LRNLQDGWNNGEGVRLSERGLSWLYCSFSYGFPTYLPSPFIYPTVDGRVFMEWHCGSEDTSLEIDLETHQGELHRLDLLKGDVAEFVVNLDENMGWRKVCRMIQESEKRAGQRYGVGRNPNGERAEKLNQTMPTKI